MRKTGTYAATSLRLFQDVTHGPTHSKILSIEEELWISKSSTGAISWAKQYTGEAIQYDINEFYPSVLLQKNAQWPTESGIFLTLTNLNKNLEYGIYRVNIEGLPKKYEAQCTRLFRYNQEQYYTHYDIECARKNGLQVKLINISPNAYIFKQSHLTDGETLFENWARQLIRIKRQKGIAGNVAKKLLVSLWGILCENQEKMVKLVHINV